MHQTQSTTPSRATRSLPGWSEPITKALQWVNYPRRRATTSSFISEYTHTEVKLIAVGPGRNETIVMP